MEILYFAPCICFQLQTNLSRPTCVSCTCFKQLRYFQCIIFFVINKHIILCKIYNLEINVNIFCLKVSHNNRTVASIAEYYNFCSVFISFVTLSHWCQQSTCPNTDFSVIHSLTHLITRWSFYDIIYYLLKLLSHLQ